MVEKDREADGTHSSATDVGMHHSPRSYVIVSAVRRASRKVADREGSLVK
jgi:hypothetical protein